MATSPWITLSVASVRCGRGRARSTTRKPSARRRRMTTESTSCHVSHSSITSNERSRNSTCRSSSFAGDSERTFMQPNTRKRPSGCHVRQLVSIHIPPITSVNTGTCRQPVDGDDCVRAVACRSKYRHWLADSGLDRPASPAAATITGAMYTQLMYTQHSTSALTQGVAPDRSDIRLDRLLLLLLQKY